MKRQRTLGTQLGVGFAVLMVLALVSGIVSVLALRAVVDAKDTVIVKDAPRVVDTHVMRTHLERTAAAARGFLLTGEQRFVQLATESRREVATLTDHLRASLHDEQARRLLDAVVRADAEYTRELDAIIATRKADASLQVISEAFEQRVVPKRDALVAALVQLSTHQMRELETSRAAASETASDASTVVIAIVVVTIILGLLLSWLLTRRLSRQIGSAIGHVQSSSSELQAAANQQATGAKEQATAMAEITTTITELLATSRQIAESAQRVAQIAGQTASSASSGNTTVDQAHTSIDAIRQQVDLVVAHMLELGKKSQEIGSVLDLVSELAEQTNILAINATIEAAGAGEAGKRFAVVADEIRKLADRVSGSTKQIRTLIDDVRGAVNKTVMVTESGSKAVDSGSKHFDSVAALFKSIASLVTTTTEAAREIELSTKQQKSAVEQVNVAIASVAQATKETEASSAQTLLTAGELATLSNRLQELVEPERS